VRRIRAIVCDRTRYAATATPTYRPIGTMLGAIPQPWLATGTTGRILETIDYARPAALLAMGEPTWPRLGARPSRKFRNRCRGQRSHGLR
jgi:hypothetical protein